MRTGDDESVGIEILVLDAAIAEHASNGSDSIMRGPGGRADDARALGRYEGPRRGLRGLLSVGKESSASKLSRGAFHNDNLLRCPGGGDVANLSLGTNR